MCRVRGLKSLFSKTWHLRRLHTVVCHESNVYGLRVSSGPSFVPYDLHWLGIIRLAMHDSGILISMSVLMSMVRLLLEATEDGVLRKSQMIQTKAGLQPVIPHRDTSLHRHD